MSKILSFALKVIFVSSFLSPVISAQTDMNKLLASAPFETVQYKFAAGVFGVWVGNLMTVERREAGDDFIITSIVEYPDGIVRNTAIVDRKTLRLKKGISEEFDKTIEYEIADGKITGSERRGKKVKNFSVVTGGDVYDMRGYFDVVYETLPLADNYSGSLKIFYPKKKEIRDIEFKVLSSETISIGRGVFDCFKIEASSNEDGSGKYIAWVDKRTRRAIRLKGYGGFAKMFGGEAEILLPERRL
jgi:hypothetical protein